LAEMRIRQEVKTDKIESVSQLNSLKR